MKVVIAPDSFKGSLSAPKVCETIKKAFSNVMPSAEIVGVPMADGGEGTLDALVNATSGVKVPVTVMGPLLEQVEACYGVLGDGETAVIEMAQVAGLTMVPENLRDPLKTSTYGIGEVLRLAMEAGYRRFIVGLGGSATNDGGLGFLQALGGTFLNDRGEPVRPVGGALAEIHRVDLGNIDARLAECQIVIASDVDNPLCGPRGASVVFGPQKGATPEQVTLLDQGLSQFAQLVEAELGQAYQNQPGAGAAGGIGFGLLVIGATIQSGARMVADAARLDEHLAGADFVITGEGRTDEQTLHGKVPYVVAQMAQQYGVKALLLSGSVDEGLSNLEEVFVSLHAIVSRPMTTTEAMANAESLLYTTARNLASRLQGPNHGDADSRHCYYHCYDDTLGHSCALKQ